jgi:DNA-binding Lrp family transcriptional regulator
MDELDHQLIARLRTNARIPVSALAKELHVARGTVQNRLAKLERDGIIVGYTVRLRSQLDERRITALMTIAVEGNRADTVLRTLRGDPAIQTLHTTNGRWDIMPNCAPTRSRPSIASESHPHGRGHALTKTRNPLNHKL